MKRFFLFFAVAFIILTFFGRSFPFLKEKGVAFFSFPREKIGSYFLDNDASNDWEELYLDKKFLMQENESLEEALKEACDFPEGDFSHLKALKKVPAQVILRAPSSWNSTLWVNVGKETNKKFNKEIVSEGSPVLSGDSVVGVIEYVGEVRSKVRLITDASLVLSVRVLRKGEGKDFYLQKSLEKICLLLEENKNFEQEKKILGDLLKKQKEKALEEPLYLAKGEIQGTSQPLWRKKGAFLKGMGFNLDFEDVYSKPRDLRSGRLLENEEKEESSISLLQKGDLLITTGLDGVFPFGLLVGKITQVFPLEEGDYYYSIEAEPAAGKMQDLHLLFILEPIPI